MVDESVDYNKIQMMIITKSNHTRRVSPYPPWEDQCEWHRMTINRMTGPDCAVKCNFINVYTYIHTQ